MNYLLIGFRWRFGLAVLLSTGVLIIGLFWKGGQSPSWAAPEQNPYLQTVPTRGPDELTPLPPAPVPPQRNGNKDRDGKNDDGVKGILQTQPSSTEADESNALPDQLLQEGNKTPIAQPSQKESGDQKDNVPLVQPSTGEDTNEADNVSPAQSPGETTAATLFDNNWPAASAFIHALETPLSGVASLGWLCALGLGLILILSGIFLVNRA